MSTIRHPSAASAPDVDDAQAIAEIAAGHRDFFAVIVRRYNAQLYRTGMAYLGHHEQVEDAMQNAYLKAFHNLSRFRGAAGFGTWLTRIMINECLMTLRRRRRFVVQALEDCEIASREVAEEPRLTSADLRAVLEKAVARLPRSQRAVYLLRDVQNLSVQETADCLQLTTANVKVLLHRAHEGLKRDLLRGAAGSELFAYTASFCEPMTRRVMALIAAR